MTVFCEPFFASMGHWKPTHACWWMQAGRPLYGTELRRNGAWNGWRPIFFPTSHTSCDSGSSANGGIGNGCLRGAANGFPSFDPATPTSRSAW